MVGYDAGKKVKGRKIHALVDTEGLPMRVVVHSAGVQDRDGAALVLDKIRIRFPWLELVWADSGYHARQVDAAVAIVPALRLEIVKRSDDMKGFVVLPRRWVVERTFSWFGRNRRLTKDYENLVETLAAFVALACIQIASGNSRVRRAVNRRPVGSHFGTQLAKLPGRPAGLSGSTLRPNRCSVRQMKLRSATSSRKAGCARGPLRVWITSPSAAIRSHNAPNRSSASQICANSSTPPMSAMAYSCCAWSHSLRPGTPRGRGG